MLIVVDGAVDLPEDLETSGRARVVPGGLFDGAGPFDGDRGRLWESLRQGAFPSSRPPTVNALLEAYRHDGLVLGLHVSAELSATVSRAREAAVRAGPGVVVVDTRSLSVGAGLVAAAVDRAARDPGSSESVVERARSLPERVHTFVLVQDAAALRRSGRAGLLPSGGPVRDRPVVLAVRGRAVVLDQPRDRHRAVRRLVEHVRNHAEAEGSRWALGHGDAGDLDLLAGQLSASFGRPPDFVSLIDPTVGVHVGAEAIVVGVLAEPAEG